MADTYALINADNTWASGPLGAEPTPADGQRVIIVSLAYPDGCYWSPANGGGFVDIPKASPLMSVGRFKLLLTQQERIAIRAAAANSVQVEDFLDLLNGFTDGVSLSDPVLSASLDQLVSVGLLTTDRKTAILAGTPPS